MDFKHGDHSTVNGDRYMHRGSVYSKQRRVLEKALNLKYITGMTHLRWKLRGLNLHTCFQNVSSLLLQSFFSFTMWYRVTVKVLFNIKKAEQTKKFAPPCMMHSLSRPLANEHIFKQMASQCNLRIKQQRETRRSFKRMWSSHVMLDRPWWNNSWNEWCFWRVRPEARHSSHNTRKMKWVAWQRFKH